MNATIKITLIVLSVVIVYVLYKQLSKPKATYYAPTGQYYTNWGPGSWGPAQTIVSVD